LSKKCCIEPNIVVFFFVHQIISINLMNYRKMPRTFIRTTYILRFSYNFSRVHTSTKFYNVPSHFFFSFRSRILFFQKKNSALDATERKKRKKHSGDKIVDIEAAGFEPMTLTEGWSRDHHHLISQISARKSGSRLLTSLRSKHVLELRFPSDRNSTSAPSNLAKATIGSFFL